MQSLSVFHGLSRGAGGGWRVTVRLAAPGTTRRAGLFRRPASLGFRQLPRIPTARRPASLHAFSRLRFTTRKLCFFPSWRIFREGKKRTQDWIRHGSNRTHSHPAVCRETPQRAEPFPAYLSGGGKAKITKPLRSREGTVWLLLTMLMVRDRGK